MELTAGGKTLAEGKIQGGNFQGDVLLPLLLVIRMMTFNYIENSLRATNYKTQEKINHFMYMEEIKLFAKKEKNGESDTSNKIYWKI